MLALSLGFLVASAPSLTLAGTGEAGRDPSLAVASAAKQFEKPKNRGIPGRRAPGGTRGTEVCVAADQKQLMAIVLDSNIATTISEYPTLFFYVPETLAKFASLELYEVNGNGQEQVYATTLPVPQGSGIISLTLPKSTGLKPLTPGKTYIYWFALNCPPELNPEKKPTEISVLGYLQRSLPSTTLANQLRKAKPTELPAIYAQNGIWTDLLVALAELRQANPTDPSPAKDWSGLLKGAGLQSYADAPLLPCCTPSNKRAARPRR